MIANKPSQELQDIGYEIGHFYLKKCGNNYQAAQKEVESLKITNIEKVNDDTINITLARPGLLIGRKGQNIEALVDHLKKKINITEGFHWDSVLVPEDPMGYMLGCY